MKKTTPKCILIKMVKTSDKEKILRGFQEDDVTGSTKNLSPLYFPRTPRQQLPWQILSDITILEFQSLLKACSFQGKAQTGKLQLISVNLSSQHISSCASPISTHPASNWSSLHTAWGSQGEQKGPCPPNLRDPRTNQ